MRKFFILNLLLILWSSNIALARFATPGEVNAEQELCNIKINVNGDGDSELVQEVQFKILNEAGREQLAMQSFAYNSNNEKIEILEAKTINGDKEYPVDKKMIEDKTIAGGASGFDDINQIQIAYPNINIGSSVYFKIKATKKAPVFNGLYEALYAPGSSDFYIKHYELEVDSKLKLNLEVNDPHLKLEVKYENEKESSKLKIKLKTPLIEKLVFEDGVLTREQMTFVAVSSIDNYGQYVANVAPHYEEVINDQLPKLLSDIVQNAGGLKTEVEQINYVTARLAEKIRYMGDWRTVKGKFYPRSFEEVVTSGYGDCKDFASMTVAILRKLGFKAFPSLVYRGEGVFFGKPKIVQTMSFNHVLAKVEAKEGKTLWVDPTNFVSYALGIFPDIADRPALVLDLESPAYMRIPQIDPKSALYENKYEIKLTGSGDGEIQGDFLIKGGAAASLTGAGLIYSKKELEEKFIYMLSGEVAPENVQMEFSDLTSRIVKDIAIKYKYSLSNICYQTNLGLAFSMGNKWPDIYIDTSTDQVGTIYVGFPKTMLEQVIFKNIKSISPEKLSAEIKSKWFDAKRTCKASGGDIICQEETTIFASFIGPEDIKSQDFIETKKQLKKYFTNSALIY